MTVDQEANVSIDSNVDRAPASSRTRRPAPTPAVLDHRANVRQALDRLIRRGQAVAFVRVDGEVVGVVTLEDLWFTDEWAGPAALVADAMTYCVVEVATGASAGAAAHAFNDSLRGWLRANQGRLRPRPARPAPRHEG